MLGVQADRLWAVVGHNDRVALGLEPGAYGLGDRLLIVDDEDRLFAHRAIVALACCVPEPRVWRTCDADLSGTRP